MGLINNGKFVQGKPPSRFTYPFPVDYGCKFKRADSDSFNGPTESASATNGTTWTFSFWCKRASFGTSQTILSESKNTDNQMKIIFTTADTLSFKFESSAVSDFQITTQVFKDPSSWYHIVVAVDTTQAVAADRVSIWVNGVEVTDFSTADTIPLNANVGPGHDNARQCIGRDDDGNDDYFDGYLAEVYQLADQKLDADSFGMFQDGVWVPIQFTGSYLWAAGDFYLTFANASDLLEDSSGLGNDLSSESGTPAQTLDTPTNNFPIFDDTIPTAEVISLAGMKMTTTNASYSGKPLSIAIPSTGVWQVELELATGSGDRGLAGIVVLDEKVWTDRLDYDGVAYYGNNGDLYVDGTPSSFGDTYAAGDVIGVVVDMDAGNVEFFKNNVSQGTHAIDTSKQWCFAAGDVSTSYAVIWELNNGAEGGFDYPVTGALPLCTENLPVPEVIDGEMGLWVNARTGTGAIVDVTGAPFNVSTESLVWTKNRDQADSHKLVDTVRGATNRLSSDLTAAETVDSAGITGFLSNGFSLGTGAGGYNDSGEAFIDWVFNMIAKYGMDIVTYSGNGVAGTEISHSLGGIPEMMIVKCLTDGTQAWVVYHKNVDDTAPEDYFLKLNTNDSRVDSDGPWYDTAPTATVFTVGSGDTTNKNGEDYVAYLFRSIPGFIKIGYYTGNASTNGVRVHTDFRVRYLLRKASASAVGWTVMDAARDPHNVVTSHLLPHASSAEASGSFQTDFLANGFKLRSTNNTVNANGVRYLYLAIADTAFPYANAF